MSQAKLKTRVRLDNESKFVVVGPKEEVKQEKNSTSALMFTTEIGFSVALPIIAGAFFGLKLDEKFASKPKMTLIFLAIGFVVGFANLWLTVAKFSKKHLKNRKP